MSSRRAVMSWGEASYRLPQLRCFITYGIYDWPKAVIFCHLYKVAISLYSRVKIHHESNWKLWQSWPIGEHLWELLLNMIHLDFLNISPLLLRKDVEKVRKSCGSCQCLVFIHQSRWWLTLVKKLILVLQYLVVKPWLRINWGLPFHWVCDKVQSHIR